MDVPPLLEWGATQGHILTGAGKLNSVFIPGKHYVEEDLPHYWKSQGKLHETFNSWHQQGLTNSLVAGAWSRPLFTGGWRESGGWDTNVFNIQTPSLFVDLRFPCSLPNFTATSYEQLPLDQLRALSRQHCFAGYTKIQGSPPVATRHHAIDWNYHPDFPRARPNMWRIQAHEDGTSFKEWSVALDQFGQAIYMERWARLQQSRRKFLSLHKRSSHQSILCITGIHFAFASDRRGPLPSFPSATSGGCGSLVDDAWKRGDRESMINMLSLEGSYGFVNDWKIQQSTVPWLKGKPLFSAGDIFIHIDPGNTGDIHITWKGETWDVLDCTFSKSELQHLFTPKTTITSRL